MSKSVKYLTAAGHYIENICQEAI